MTGSGGGKVLALTCAAILPLAVASVLVGAADFHLTRALSDPYEFRILVISRLPRTLAVILTGAAMAVAGVLMQQMVRNRFVEPTTTGTAESAALGLLVVTIFAPAAPVWAKMLAAAMAALGGTAIFLALVRRLPPAEPLLVPITGLIFSGVVYAIVTFIGWQTDLLQYVLTWLESGEFSGVLAGRYELLWVAGMAALLAWFAADQFAILGLGRAAATGLGLNFDQVRALGLTVVAVVTALVVVTVGMIPFVGLVVPNIVSRIAGDNLRRTLPIVAAGGAILVLFCDVLGRVIRHPYEIPAGTVIGVVGAAAFLWLLHGRPVRD